MNIAVHPAAELDLLERTPTLDMRNHHTAHGLSPAFRQFVGGEEEEGEGEEERSLIKNSKC